MKKGQIYEGMVERVDFPNKGIVVLEEEAQAAESGAADAGCDGATGCDGAFGAGSATDVVRSGAARGEKHLVVVKNALPGQRISFCVTKVRKGKGEGRLLKVLEPSPLELKEPVCEHFGVCGGCTFLSLPREEQLKLKERQVRSLLEPVCAPYCDFDRVFEGIKASPRQYGYRNKMEFSFGDEVKDGPLALGLHKRGSFHDIVTVTGCRIADEDFSRILEWVLAYFRERRVPYFHKTRHEGYLRHLLVRKAAKTGEILVDLVTSGEFLEGLECGVTGESPEKLSEEELLSGMTDGLLELELDGRIVGILRTKNDSVADAVINQGTSILYGQDYFYEELLGLRFQISPFSFFQTNSLGAEVLYETAREYIGDVLTEGKDKVVFDLYSGTGTIAQILSPVAKKMVGVEIVPEAVEAARENARLNGLSNCEFIAGDVLKVLDGIEDKPDFIVLDPPRDGIHPKALEKIVGFGVERMVYISCKPTSLARDLVVLQESGYRVERACCVDMFPGSANVETCVLLSRKT